MMRKEGKKQPFWIAAALAACVWGNSSVRAAPFQDVPAASPFSTSIEDLQRLGVTDGMLRYEILKKRNNTGDQALFISEKRG